MQLLERDEQLGALSTLFVDAEAGSGRLAFVAGDAGSGKSALVRGFCESIARTTPVLWGLCDPLGTPRPLGPLVDVAPQLGEDVNGLLRNAERADVFNATLTALRTQRRAAVLVFEDLHWADEATLDLVRFVGRRLGNVRALILGSYRDDEVGPDHPMRLVLGDLASVEAVRRIAVPPLSLDAVTHLASGTAIDPLTLHRESGGNAFFVTEVLRAGGNSLPPTVADVVLARVARLSPSARGALEAAAVIGMRVEPWLITRMPEVTAAALDECVSGGMLQFAPPQYEFRHELARHAVLSAISPARCAAMHADVLALLRDTIDPRSQLDRLAYHAEAAGDAEATLEFAPAAAAVSASVKSHRVAAAHYAQAVRYASRLPPPQRAELFEKASYERHVIDDLVEAAALAEQARDLWREAGQLLKVGDVSRWLSRVYWLGGRTPDAEREADAAVRLLEQLPRGHELARAYSNKAQLCMVGRRVADAEVWAVKAIDLARELDALPIVAHALNNLGAARMIAGDRGGEALLRESLELSVELGLEDDAARAWTNLAACLDGVGDLAAARAYAEDGIRYCIDYDLDGNRVCVGSALAQLDFKAGDWDAAATLASAMNQEGRLSRISKAALQALLARIRVRRGEGGAWALLDDSLAIARAAGDLQFRVPVAVARAEALWFDGRAADIPAEIDGVFREALATNDDNATAELGYWLWKAGALTTPIAPSARPYVLQVSGDWRAAREAWLEMGCPYEAAVALADSDQEEDLRTAITELAKLGAKPAIAEITQRLRSLGARSVPRGPRPRTLQNPAGLTARELEVLTLLAGGMRNPDIAQRLFLSPKTVDHHVSAILAKLAVRTRHEAAERARELVGSSNGSRNRRERAVGRAPSPA